jgi:hypothetical protein
MLCLVKAIMANFNLFPRRIEQIQRIPRSTGDRIWFLVDRLDIRIPSIGEKARKYTDLSEKICVKWVCVKSLHECFDFLGFG